MRIVKWLTLLLFPVTLWAQTTVTPICLTTAPNQAPVIGVCPAASPAVLPSNPTFVTVTTTGVSGDAGGHIYTAGPNAPKVIAGQSSIYADAATKRLVQNPNAGGPSVVCGVQTAIPAGHVPMMAANGYDVVDSGLVMTPALVAAIQKWMAGGGTVVTLTPTNPNLNVVIPATMTQVSK